MESFRLCSQYPEVVYDEASPTCLVWTTSKRANGKGKAYIAGDFVGGGVGKYAQVRLNGTKMYVHRVVWEIHYGEIPEGFDIDHFDRNKRNNFVSNLRCIPHIINQRNTSKFSNNSSGITGVRYESTRHRWQAKWNDLDGREKSKSFSVLKYGDNAKILACEFRENVIKSLNSAGAGYSTNHGK